MTRVAIVIVAYQGTRYLGDCLESVRRAKTDSIDLCCCVLDNASSDGTADFVRQHYPECEVVDSPENLGFAEGNNAAWRHLEESFPDSDFVYLLNQDTIVDAEFLIEAVEYLGEHPQAGAAQSLLMLHPETQRINTAGNQLHFLGFGLPTRYRQVNDAPVASGEIGYPSGAAVLIRSAWLRQHGLFTGELFMYLEDAELGWNLHLTGNPPHLCRSSVVYHKHQFGSTITSYYYLEKNRLWLVLTHFRLMTLVLLSPALLLMELGQCLYSLTNGVFAAKCKTWIDLLRLSSVLEIWKTRRRIGRLRKIRDREVLKIMSGRIESVHLDSVLLRHLANPLFSLYHRMLGWVVWW